MTWTELDWRALDRLRERFLQGSASSEPYWETASDLASYDVTYGERIGWKWDHILREVRLRGYKPRSRDVFDWGCGSGVASRRVIESFGGDQFDSLTVWDHSPLACEYAAARARKAFPLLRVTEASLSLLKSDTPIGLLVISHVLNELPPAAATQVRQLCERAESVLWVEPGTHATSRALGQFRDALRAQFKIVAPCTHELGCPMFTEGNERHWCHFFAPPPAEIFGDSNWVKFGQRAGIDLRSLPYAFVALQRDSPALLPEGWSRVIGRVEHFKPYARWLNCDATGLAELELLKRADPALFKQLERTRAPLVYRWQRDDRKVATGEPLGSPPR